MCESPTTKRIHSLVEQLRNEKTAHAATRNLLQSEIDRVWRLVPSHYVNLMGVYPPLRLLLRILVEAADLQDPSKGAAYEDTMRTEYTPDGETLTQTERGVLTHRRHRATVVKMNDELDWLTHKLSKLIPGTEVEYHPPQGECECGCGRLNYQNDTGRKRRFYSAKCRQRASRKVEA
jgi:hypothetical protein